MPEQSYSQIMRALNAKDALPSGLSRAYLLVGSDDVLKHEILDRLKALALDPGFADFDYESIDVGPAGAESEGASDPVLKILSSAAAAPFSSARRVVVVKSVQRLTSERQTALGQGASTLGSLSLLILVADAPEIEAGRPKGKSIDASLKRAIATHGVTVTCEAPPPADMKSRAQALFEDWGLRGDSAVCNAVADYASTVSANAGSGATAILTRECEKLRAYVGDRKSVEISDVEALIPAVTQENIFRLLDCVGNRSLKDALAQVDSLLLSGDKPDAVAARTFVMLQRHIRLLILGKHVSGARGSAQKSEGTSELLTSELSGVLNGQSYRLQSYVRQAANFTWDELNHALMRILASDMTMKGMFVPKCFEVNNPVMPDQPAANLKMLVTELCMK